MIAFTPILRAELAIVDDIGLLPLSGEAAEGLYRLVDGAYARRSLAIRSNLHPPRRGQLMDRTIATALGDGLLHHAHVIVTDGDSVRLAYAPPAKVSQPSPDPSIGGPAMAVPRGLRWPSPARTRGGRAGEPWPSAGKAC